MTVKELKKLIKDTVLEVIDPDYGLELRPEVEKELLESKKKKEKGRRKTQRESLLITNTKHCFTSALPQ